MSKKGFQLSVNMLVVMILGLILLGVGTSIFYTAYNRTVEVRENVDSKTQSQLNSLLDSGDPIAIPITTKDAERGKFVDFNIGLGNELGETRIFSVYVTFATTSTAARSILRPNENIQSIVTTLDNCPNLAVPPTNQNCGDLWVLMLDDFRSLELENNERQFIPVRIQIPRRLEDISNPSNRVGVLQGQYIFNVDICVNNVNDPVIGCQFADGEIQNRYFSRQKLYVNIQ